MNQNTDPPVTVRACATPAGPCVESTSTSVVKAVLGTLLFVGAAVGVSYGVSQLVESPRVPRLRASRRTSRLR